MAEIKKLTIQQLSLYLLCDVQHWEGGIYKLEGLDTVLNEVNIRKHGENRGFWELSGNVKPVLRPLHDITDEEAEKTAHLSLSEFYASRLLGYFKRNHVNTNGELVWTLSEDYVVFVINKQWDIMQGKNLLSSEPEHYPIHNIQKIFTYWISRGLDVFGWIEQGLAVDKTKLKS